MVRNDKDGQNMEIKLEQENQNQHLTSDSTVSATVWLRKLDTDQETTKVDGWMLHENAERGTQHQLKTTHDKQRTNSPKFQQQ